MSVPQGYTPPPGGELHLADYGLQSGRLMRMLFRATVQRLDGVADTQPNADGVLPALMREAGLRLERERIIATPTGSISIFLGLRGGDDNEEEAGPEGHP